MFMNQVMLLLDYNNVHNLYLGYDLICLNIVDVPSFRFGVVLFHCYLASSFSLL